MKPSNSKVVTYVTHKYVKTGDEAISVSLPHTSRVIHPVTGIPTLIRYAVGEKSIFVDEQSDQAKKYTSKPCFYHGILYVNSDEKLLIEYLDMMHLNSDSEYRLEGSAVDFFYKHDPAAEALKLNEENRLLIQAITASAHLDKDAVSRICRYCNMPMQHGYDVMLWEVQEFARRDPQGFLSLIDDPVLIVNEQLETAFTQGVIEKSPNAVKWGRGGATIIGVASGQNPLHVMRDFVLAGEEGAAVLDAILAQTRKPESVKAEETIQAAVEEFTPEASMEGLDASELFAVALKKSVVYRSGAQYKVGDQNIAKSKATAIEKIDTDFDLRTRIENGLAKKL